MGKERIQVLLATLGGALGWLLVGWDWFMYALLLFVALDYLTGVMAAFIEKKVSSEIAAKGICKKVLIFMLVGVGHIVDQYVICEGEVFRTAVIFFYISNEGISIIENSDRMGLPVPQKLKDVLAQLKSKDDTDE